MEFFFLFPFFFLGYQNKMHYFFLFFGSKLVGLTGWRLTLRFLSDWYKAVIFYEGRDAVCACVRVSNMRIVQLSCVWTLIRG